jgi:hypothetical protein
MNKVGRNDPCPCNSGKKYKRCHGRPAYQDLITHVAKGAQKRATVLKIQRERQQGKGRPIISTAMGELRIVVVGRQNFRGPWITFTDFLHDYIKLTLGSPWGNAEMAKQPEERHPLIHWYAALGELQRQHSKGQSVITATPAHGVVRAYLGLAYDLYTLEHNIDSAPKPATWQRLLHRLRHPDQFVGARYEVRIAAILLRAGFVLEWEDETVGTSTHGEFTATFPPTGRQFWVECKIRQPKTAKDAAKGLGKFLALVSNALRKSTDKERIIFVDLNTPAKVRADKNSSDWRDWAVGCLRTFEGSPEGRKLPPAIVIITNYPDQHHLDSLVPDAGAAVEGFKMDDYRTGTAMPLHEAIERRDRRPEVEALTKSMGEHTDIPSTFDGEIPELMGIENRLLIGRKYEIEPGKVGTLTEACLIETERKAAAVIQLNDGSQAIWTIPLSDNEVSAWRRYPETFLGELRPPNGSVTNLLELYDFFLSSLDKTSKENILAQLPVQGEDAPQTDLSRDELAKCLAERMTTNAARMSSGFPLPEWAARLRKPPRSNAE